MANDKVDTEELEGTAEAINSEDDSEALLTWDEFKVSRRLTPLREWRAVDSAWYDHTLSLVNEYTGEQLTISGVNADDEAEIGSLILGYNTDSHYDNVLDNVGLLEKYEKRITFAQYGVDGHGDKGMLLPIITEEEARTKVREGRPYGFVDAAFVVEGTTLVGIINADSIGSVATLVVPYGIETIGRQAFSYGALVSVEKVVLPFTVTRLEEGAFAYTHIKTVTLSPNINDIGARAFATSAIVSIELPDKVQTIKEGTFESCSNLTRVVLPRWLVTVERNAFAGCNKAFENFTLPKTLIYIDEGAFPEGEYKVECNQHLVADALYLDEEHISIFGRDRSTQETFIFDEED